MTDSIFSWDGTIAGWCNSKSQVTSASVAMQWSVVIVVLAFIVCKVLILYINGLLILSMLL